MADWNEVVSGLTADAAETQRRAAQAADLVRPILRRANEELQRDGQEIALALADAGVPTHQGKWHLMPSSMDGHGLDLAANGTWSHLGTTLVELSVDQNANRLAYLLTEEGRLRTTWKLPVSHLYGWELSQDAVFLIDSIPQADWLTRAVRDLMQQHHGVG